MWSKRKQLNGSNIDLLFAKNKTGVNYPVLFTPKGGNSSWIESPKCFALCNRFRNRLTPTTDFKFEIGWCLKSISKFLTGFATDAQFCTNVFETEQD
jgi:hypothetical protein